VYQWVVEPITSVIFGDGSSWYQLFTYFIPATLIWYLVAVLTGIGVALLGILLYSIF